jgi:hypothetical protein
MMQIKNCAEQSNTHSVKTCSVRDRARGHALVTLLIVVAASLVMISAAVAMTITTTQASSLTLQSQQALMTAESGLEEALMRLLRNPTYSGGTLTLSGSTATITVTGSNPKTVVATARQGTVVRRVQVHVAEQMGMMVVTDWKELRE